MQYVDQVASVRIDRPGVDMKGKVNAPNEAGQTNTKGWAGRRELYN